LATKFYLHNASRGAPSVGALPSAANSTLISFEDFDAQTNNHSLNTTIGISQASFSPSLNGTRNNQDRFIGKWVTDLTINQSSIAANTWIYDFAALSPGAWDYVVDDSTGTKTYVCIYVWRPSTSTVVGKIADAFTGTTYPFVGTSEVTAAGTFTGSAVSSIVANDVLVFEAWWSAGQTNTTGTFSYFFDGTTEPTATSNTAISSAASFISTPENIALIAESGGQDETIYRALGKYPALGSLSHTRPFMG
jgi:hypothetical protein